MVDCTEEAPDPKNGTGFKVCKLPHQLEGYSGMLQMPEGGAHWVVLSKHCTGGERSTDGDCRSRRHNDDDDIN
jgi:hypothetical protein